MALRSIREIISQWILEDARLPNTPPICPRETTFDIPEGSSPLEALRAIERFCSAAGWEVGEVTVEDQFGVPMNAGDLAGWNHLLQEGQPLTSEGSLPDSPASTGTHREL